MNPQSGVFVDKVLDSALAVVTEAQRDVASFLEAHTAFDHLDHAQSVCRPFELEQATVNTAVEHMTEFEKCAHAEALASSDMRVADALARNALRRIPLYSGVIKAFGSAPHRDVAGAAESGFVVLCTEKGERTLWGIGLQESFATSDLRSGERVSAILRGWTWVAPDGAGSQRARQVWVLRRRDDAPSARKQTHGAL